ncbi:MAG: c-type cytochrome [Bacteroidota bacterium]|nr:c-type cytochrome [Bacteroidota bacterium]
MKTQWVPVTLFLIVAIVIAGEVVTECKKDKERNKAFAQYVAEEPADTVWWGSNEYQIPTGTDNGKLILYGHDLIENTSYYLGPKGTVAQISNGMNCQNCHLKAGIVPYGNNYGKVFSTYPQFRARNNGLQDIYARVNDCFERSLNGKALDTTTHEMKAIYAYMKWLGEGISKGDARGGTGIEKLKYLNRAANPAEGRIVYVANCQSCHGNSGQGVENGEANGYVYPPLWGEHSYNDGAGLYRLSNFAGFVKNNMPFGTDYHKPVLSYEEAWDVAAFVNSQPRPHKDQSEDWKNITKKPFDYPFGPYIDSFSEKQHKYGPYKPIKEAMNHKNI